jgi:hypothetical protein
MSRQPPVTALQFGRVNKPKLAAEIVRKAIKKAKEENNPVIHINANLC